MTLVFAPVAWLAPGGAICYRKAMAGLFTRKRIRAAVGLIAAYAIALQALFTALAPLPANAAGVDFGVLCFGSGNNPAATGEDDGAPAPASGKFHCVLCVALGTAAVLPEPAISTLERSSTLSVFSQAIAEIFVAPLSARSGPSRAPPLTM